MSYEVGIYMNRILKNFCLIFSLLFINCIIYSMPSVEQENVPVSEVSAVQEQVPVISQVDNSINPIQLAENVMQPV